MADIYKSAGIIIRDKKLLVVKAHNKDYYFSPGGKIESGETPAQSLVRELKEELAIVCTEADFEPFGTFHANANDRPELTIENVIFTVINYVGELTPSSEIVELRWLTSVDQDDSLIGSIFAHKVMPKLKEQGLID